MTLDEKRGLITAKVEELKRECYLAGWRGMQPDSPQFASLMSRAEAVFDTVTAATPLEEILVLYDRYLAALQIVVDFLKGS
jgi:hypothetical protein